MAKAKAKCCLSCGRETSAVNGYCARCMRYQIQRPGQPQISDQKDRAARPMRPRQTPEEDYSEDSFPLP